MFGLHQCSRFSHCFPKNNNLTNSSLFVLLEDRKLNVRIFFKKKLSKAKNMPSDYGTFGKAARKGLGDTAAEVRARVGYAH